MLSSEQTSAFRAMLAADFDRYQELASQLESAGRWKGYGALVGAAFFLAVRAQFPDGHSSEDVIQLVADLRAQFDPDGESLDPHQFELVVRSSLGERGVAAHLDDQTVLQIQVVTVGGLAAAGRVGDLDEFATRAEALATKWLA